MRSIDIVSAVALLILLSPLLVMLSLVVTLSSKGPVLFRQKRVGLGGTHFDLLKFRTMIEGADMQVLDDPELWRAYVENDFKLPPDDPRITPIGRLLRRTSVDELPQLANVIRGEMSIVGVRPLLAGELSSRPQRDRALYELHRPGITGLWQVVGRSAVGGNVRLQLDRQYLESWSVINNLNIALRTPRAVLLGIGAR